MASSSPDEARAAQEAIAALAAKPLRAVWRLWDGSRMSSSLPIVRLAVGAVVDTYGQAAAAQSMQHYRAARLDSGVTERLSLPALDPIPDGFVDSMLVDALAAAEADIQAAMADLDAKAEQLILDQGRRRVLTAAKADKFAKGWARIPNPGACSFCLMLAARSGSGLLYTSVRSANFRAHDKCRCTAEAVFGRYEPSAQVREAMRLWDESTKGRTGHDARVAFRQAVEGRPVTGARRPTARRPDAKPFEGGQRTPENQRYQLRLLEALPPAKTPEAAKWRADRIAEIRKYLGE